MRLLILSLITLLGSNSLNAQHNQTESIEKTNLNTISKEELIARNWQHLDLERDSIPGVSTDKAYDLLLSKKDNPQEVIVAVLDTKLAYNHPDLIDNIWINQDEIANNQKDDDNNGYIDDIQGWNFLGNAQNQDLLYQHSAELRLFKILDGKYKNVDTTKITTKQERKEYKSYLAAKTSYQSDLKEIKSRKKLADSLNTLYFVGKDTLKAYFGTNSYTKNDLDSLITSKPEIKKYVWLNQIVTGTDLTEKDIADQATYFNEQINYVLNINHDERSLIGDDPLDVNDRFYGNNIINGDVPFQHATSVAGVLGATRNNNEGIRGFSDYIKIMPIVMVATGGEHDKDVALAIRYAVDNGAQIINMSWGSQTSTHTQWVKEAILYAQKNDVLIVKAAGNDNENTDLIPYFPVDHDINNVEFTDNLVVVGATTKSFDQNFKASFSSYGKENVDLFAPGHEIFLTKAPTEYEYNSGTSCSSPIVAGIAALLRSYYPSLTAPEVKQILMTSAVKHDILVKIPSEKETDLMIPFVELSKSGGIVNAYNALLLAEEFVKEKK